MSESEIIDLSLEILSQPLFSVSDTVISVATILTVFCIIGATFWMSRLVRRAIELYFSRRGVTARGTIDAINRLAHYVVIFAGFGLALQTLGISFGGLFAAGAVFAVGIGFAMQNIAQNFVSGVILLAERAIRKGDIVRVDNEVVRVEELGIRSTMVQTRDGLELIVPNATIVQSTVTNYTLNSPEYRVRLTVGVTYDSDLDLVRRTLAEVAADESKSWGIEGRSPQVVLVDFGSSSVDFQLAVWIDDPWSERTAVSELRFAVWYAFKRAGLVIAYPQLDVHFDPGVEASLANLSVAR